MYRSLRSVPRYQKLVRRGTSLLHRPPPSFARKIPPYAAVFALATASGLWIFQARGDEVPSLADSSHDCLEVPPGPSDEDVSATLNRGAISCSVNSIAGIQRYYIAQVPSNNPCEDRYIHGTFSPRKDESVTWMAWGVFDGHSGWQTAEILKKQLVTFVRRQLWAVEGLEDENRVSTTAVQRAISTGFETLDKLIVDTAMSADQSEEPLQDTVKKLAPTFAGSCGLLSLFDPVQGMLHVACTGDSRAVLCRKTSDGKWEAVVLSTDQNGKNKEEIRRIEEEHPGEDKIGGQGRMLGLAVSRAFGDGLWKLPVSLQTEYKKKFFGPKPLTPRYPVLSPPYLTARPEVTSTKIEGPSILILATDGLWDYLSNQQAVDLMGPWLDSQAQLNNESTEPAAVYGKFDFGQFWKGVDWRFVAERTTVQDANPAVHLARNALGGNHRELIAGRLAYEAPLSRRVRDDMTVQVVFFDGV